MIPKPLKFLYPGMNEKDYLEKKQQPMWVYTLSGVCDECHQTLIDLYIYIYIYIIAQRQTETREGMDCVRNAEDYSKGRTCTRV